MKILDNGVVRDATPEELEEINSRAPTVPPPLADAVPMLNLQLTLIDDGKLTRAEEIIAGVPDEDGQRARAYWARAMTARIDNELVQLLWPQLYETEEAFHEAWRRAAALNP